MGHLSREHLEAGLDHVRESPRDRGLLVLVVRRPRIGQRDLLHEAVLDQVRGLDGDNWLTRGSSSTPDGSAHPDKQVTVINSRLAELVADGTERMSLAGDQLYVDLDLSADNLPPGSLLAVGGAVLRVSAAPHLGCAKFIERFGTEAMRFVNSRIGRQLRLRGLNTRIVVPGVIRVGDLAVKSRPWSAGVDESGGEQGGDDVADRGGRQSLGGIADGEFHALDGGIGGGPGGRPGPDPLLDGQAAGRRRETVRRGGQQQVHHRDLRGVRHDPDAG